MATATAVSANCGAVPATVPLHRRPRSFDRRQRLILENLVEVRRVARRICARLPKHVPFEQARSALIARLGRFPSETEVAELLVLRLDKYQHILTQLHSLAAGKRQGLPESTSRETARLTPSVRMSEDPFQLCARAESTRILAEAIKTLGAKERKTLALYYFEERTMKEVGTLLKIQESRVSQIIRAALNRLRAHLQERLIAWPHPG